VQLCGSLSILWHCLSLGLECKLTFSSPVATAEFSKFAGILSAALSQHHLSGFGIAPLEFYHCWEPVRNSAHDKGHEEGGSAYGRQRHGPQPRLLDRGRLRRRERGRAAGRRSGADAEGRDRREGSAAREGDRDRACGAREEPAGHAEAAAISAANPAGSLAAVRPSRWTTSQLQRSCCNPM